MPKLLQPTPSRAHAQRRRGLQSPPAVAAAVDVRKEGEGDELRGRVCEVGEASSQSSKKFGRRNVAVFRRVRRRLGPDVPPLLPLRFEQESLTLLEGEEGLEARGGCAQSVEEALKKTAAGLERLCLAALKTLFLSTSSSAAGSSASTRGGLKDFEDEKGSKKVPSNCASSSLQDLRAAGSGASKFVEMERLRSSLSAV